MKPLLLFLFLFSCFAFQTAHGGALSDTIHLTPDMIGLRPGNDTSYTIKLRGRHDNLFNWRYKAGDSTCFAAKDFNDSSWERSVAQFYSKEIEEGKVGKHIAWFRVPVKADERVLFTSVCFQFEGIGAMEVYLDGRLLSKIGEFAANGKQDYFNLNSKPVFISFQDTNVHILAVRYENNDVKINEERIWGFNLNVERADSFFTKTKSGYTYVAWGLIGMGTIFFTLFIVHFLMYLFYRREYSNFYFALFTLSLAVIIYYTHAIFIAERPKEYSSFASTLLAVTSIIAPTSLSAFIAALFSKRKLFLKIILGLAVITLITTIVDINSSYQISDFLILVMLVLSIGYALIMIITAMVKRMPGAWLLGSGIMLCMVFWIAVAVWGIVAKSMNFNNTLLLLALLSSVSIPLSISAFLAWRFASTNRNLNKQLANVEALSLEKQSILENQNAHLENEVAIRTRQIGEEKRRSDELLLNILPLEVAEELKLHGHSKAQRYDEVSVLFTDFVNFTKISEQIGVEDLLHELNINFTGFDHILEKHGLEKIKTIGDAYLAVCGVPAANARHAHNAVSAALEILDFVNQRKTEVPYGLDIRIGIHSGSLIAGIIGVKKFAYDIWGDTVNTAARMEQTSRPGKINISESTFKLVKDEFMCTYRGKIDAKGKGEMDMYFVEGRK